MPKQINWFNCPICLCCGCVALCFNRWIRFCLTTTRTASLRPTTNPRGPKRSTKELRYASEIGRRWIEKLLDPEPSGLFLRSSCAWYHEAETAIRGRVSLCSKRDKGCDEFSPYAQSSCAATGVLNLGPYIFLTKMPTITVRHVSLNKLTEVLVHVQ